MAAGTNGFRTSAGEATSEIYYAQLVEEESTRTVMAGLCEVIETSFDASRAMKEL